MTIPWEHQTLNMLCRKDNECEKCGTNPAAFRLPLRHEVGERVGVRWCSGLTGSMFSTKHNEHRTLKMAREDSRPTKAIPGYSSLFHPYPPRAYPGGERFWSAAT